MAKSKCSVCGGPTSVCGHERVAMLEPPIGSTGFLSARLAEAGQRIAALEAALSALVSSHAHRDGGLPCHCVACEGARAALDDKG